MFSEPFQHPSRDTSVFGSVLRVDEDVVNVYADDSFHDEVLKDIVHHCLERSWTIGQTEEHHQRLIQPSVCPKCCLPLVSILNPNIVVPPSDIQLREVLSSPEMINQLWNEGEWIPIFDGHGIQPSVVLHEPKQTFLLFDEEDRRS